MASADRMGFDRPRVFHPAGFVDEMDIDIAEETATGPEEAVKAFDLIHDFGLAFRFFQGKGGSHWSVHPVAAHVGDVPDFAILDALPEFLTGAAMADHQADSDFEVFLGGFLPELQHAAGGRTVRGNRLFHEDMEAAVDGILEMKGPEGPRGCQDSDAAWFQGIPGLFVSVKTGEAPLLRNVDASGFIFEFFFEGAVAAIELIAEDIRHGGEPGGEADHAQGLCGGA